MAESIHIGDTNLEFVFGDGRSVVLEPIEALVRIRAVREECAGRDDYSHATLFRDWLKESKGAAVSASEAEAVWMALEERYALEKKAWLSRMRSSSDSTESTPSPSPPEGVWDTGDT